MSEVVYVVEHLDYDSNYVSVIARTLPGAVAALKAEFGPEYVVEWAEPVESHTEHLTWWEIEAVFEHAPGYSTKHTDSWTISPHKLAS